jgi:membrane peptidoglycan carboxypeptidase
MEHTLGKPRILELYLNTVDWGPGLCGARAAARAYFGKRAAHLTPLEAAWLAGILRAPHAAHQQQFATGTPDHERARMVLMQMRSLPKAERERWARRTLVLAAARADRPVSVRSGAHVDKPVARD